MTTAKKLREEDTKKWTQKRIAAELGVARNTVSVWFSKLPSRMADKSASSIPLWV